MIRNAVSVLASLVWILPLSAGEQKIPHIGPAGKITKLHTIFTICEDEHAAVESFGASATA